MALCWWDHRVVVFFFPGCKNTQQPSKSKWVSMWIKALREDKMYVVGVKSKLKMRNDDAIHHYAGNEQDMSICGTVGPPTAFYRLWYLRVTGGVLPRGGIGETHASGGLQVQDIGHLIPAVRVDVDCAIIPQLEQDNRDIQETLIWEQYSTQYQQGEAEVEHWSVGAPEWHIMEKIPWLPDSRGRVRSQRACPPWHCSQGLHSARASQGQ